MTTDKYDLEEVSYGTTGWNGLLTTNMQKVDDYMHSRILVTLGEAAAQWEALAPDKGGDGKFYLALANIVRQPCWGLAIEAGILDDDIRMQRIGPVTNAGWSWTPGKYVFLSDVTPGALTQTPPSDPRKRQIIAFAETATKIILNPQFLFEQIGTTTSTTTTTTSSMTSSSTSQSTTTSSSTSTTTTTA